MSGETEYFGRAGKIVAAAEARGAAAERARLQKQIEALDPQIDTLVRLAVSKVDSDEIHDFDVAIGRFILNRVLALLGELGA